MQPPIRQTLSRAQRLKSRKRIAALFSGGERLQLRGLRVQYRMATERTTGLQVGFSVSARVFRRAVDRNRVKRVMREAWRLQAGILEAGWKQEHGLDLFLVYTARELPVFADVKGQVAKAIDLLMKKYFDAG